MKKLISIAVTTYNGEKFLREQLDSLYNQSIKPDEIIVCDDCSIDNTITILEEYRQKYDLIYVVNKKQLGVNKNFFQALSLCTGDYICICDQDDIWMPHKIETLYKAIITFDNNLPNCVSSQRIDIDAQGKQIVKQTTLPNSEGWKATLLTTGKSQGCTMMINQALRDQVVQLYNSNTLTDSIMYDALIGFVGAIEGNKLNLGVPLMYYRRHENNVVGKYNEQTMTFVEKAKIRPTYYPFLSDLRIKNLIIINKLYEHKSIKMEIRTFLEQIVDLYNCSNIFKGLRIICKLQIPPRLKVKICLLTPINNMLKLLIRFLY